MQLRDMLNANRCAQAGLSNRSLIIGMTSSDSRYI